MRLTIVDVQMGVVQDVLQVATVTAETFAQIIEAAAHYRHAGYRWLVTPCGDMPLHAQHDEFGLPLDDTTTEAIRHHIHSHVEIGSHLHTDEAPVYADMDGLFFRHDSINHGLRQYRRKDVTTNGVESVFAVMKRGIMGVYHHITPKHTGRYVDEFAFRLNDGDVRRPTMARLDSFVDGMAQKRLTYKALVQ
jgi:hypothetical protein